MKFSIVTPSYNQAEFLPFCLGSVVGQVSVAGEVQHGGSHLPRVTGQEPVELEYLVLDGGSRDPSAEIIRHWASRLRYWCSEPDGGQSRAINKGFRLASGDIVAWLNSDDVYLPGAFDAVARTFRQHPEAVCVYGDYIKIDAEGRTVALRRQPRFHWNLCRYAYQTIPQPASFYRREAIEKLGGLNESLHYSLDYEFFIRLGKLGPVIHVPRYLAAFRLHDDSKTVAHPARFRCEHDTVHAAHTELKTRPWLFQLKRWYYRSQVPWRLIRDRCIPSRFGWEADPIFQAAYEQHWGVDRIWNQLGYDLAAP
jgi:glycosyltransferase involved in cell wall biosynthesis